MWEIDLTPGKATYLQPRLQLAILADVELKRVRLLSTEPYLDVTINTARFPD